MDLPFFCEEAVRDDVRESCRRRWDAPRALWTQDDGKGSSACMGFLECGSEYDGDEFNEFDEFDDEYAPRACGSGAAGLQGGRATCDHPWLRGRAHDRAAHTPHGQVQAGAAPGEVP